MDVPLASARNRRLLPFVLCLAACSAPPPQREIRLEPRTEVRTFDPSGQPTSGRALADQVWGIGEASFEPLPWEEVAPLLPPKAAPQDPAATPVEGAQDPEPSPAARGDPSPQDPAEPGNPAPQDPDRPPDPDELPQDPAERLQEEARLRIAFGDTILIHDDGTVTKQYFLAADAGRVFLNLLMPIGQAGGEPPAGAQSYGGSQQDSVLGRMLGAENEVEIVYVQNFEVFRNFKPRAGNKQAQADVGEEVRNSLLLVTAKPSALRAFETALNSFYANLPQVEIEVKVVEYTTNDSLSFGAVPVDENTPILRTLSSNKLIEEITSDFPLSAPFIGASSVKDRGVISLGGIHDSWELAARLEALEVQNIADIKSQPTMVVRNGGIATVSTTTDQPFPKATISNQTVVATDIQFKPVGVVMDIRPEIAGTESVVLNVYVSVSAISGFAASPPVPTPIISSREASTSVHLRTGESTVIGGLISESTFDSETKFPILGDIPILGYLFRSTQSQSQQTILEFHITPRILRGSRGTRTSL